MALDAYSMYLDEIGRHDVLDREEERRLARAYRESGHPELAGRLAQGHLRLVVKIAHQYGWNRGELLDLIEQGNVGLLLAIRKYDPDRGVRLSSYATFWIRALILQHLVANRRLVRVGTTKNQRRVIHRLARERSPGESELGKRLGIDEGELAALARHLDSTELILDSPSFTVPLRSSASGPEDEVAVAEERAQVRAASATFARSLDTRERELFHARWIQEDQPTLSSLARRLGLSRERVRQLERRILRRFKQFLFAQR